MKQSTVLHTIGSGGPGGAETLVLNLATRLDPKRFRSIVVLPPGPWLNQKLRESGVPIYEIEWRKWFDPRGPLSMAKIVLKEKADLIHSHLPGQNFMSCITGTLTRRPTLVTYHGAVEFKDSHTVKGQVRSWIVRNSASGMIVVCDFVGDMIRSMGFPHHRVTRIYNGIDTQKFRIARSGVIRTELGIPDSVRVVTMVANIRESKGYDDFIKAAAETLRRHPDTVFLAVGDIDPVIGAPLLRLAKELGLDSRFRFLGFREDIPEILKDSDVFVLSSTSEGLPLVMLEAMASGRPMVVTRCGGPQEVLEDGETACLVPPGEAHPLAEKISYILRTPSVASKLGENAMIKVNQDFTLEGMVSKYEALYESYLG